MTAGAHRRRKPPGDRAGGWRRILALIWRTGPAAASGMVALTVASGLVPALQVRLGASVVQATMDAITGGGAAPLVRRAVLAGLAVVSLTVAAQVLGAAQAYLQSVLQLRVANEVGEQILAKAIRLELSHYENDEYYDSLQRAHRESAYRPYQLFAGAVTVSQQTVTLLSVVAVLLAWDAWTAALVVAAPLPALAANVYFGRRVYQIEHDRAADRRMAAYLQALIVNDQAYKEVHLLRLGPEFLRRYVEQLRRFYAVDRGLARRRTLVSLLLGLLSAAVAGGALLRALLDTVRHGSIGQFTGFVQAIGTVSGSATQLVTTVGQLHENALFVSNLFAFLDLPESTIRGGHRRFPRQLVYGIEFRDVTFTYPGTSAPAIRGLSCFLPAHSCVAVVGPNGAGKTTLVKLLTRLYEPTAGQILVDGVPIEQYDLADLRRGIGVMFQDFVQYELSAAENIGFGRIEELAHRGRITHSARLSGVAPVVEALPAGYDTTLGRMFHNGHQLSVGQWQKVALARAFMAGAPVVILDEPTASVDAHAEAEIFNRLREIARGATTVLVAHRFSTVRMADHILVLADGRLVESGTHEELLRAGGTYAHLYTIQAAGYRTDAAL